MATGTRVNVPAAGTPGNAAAPAERRPRGRMPVSMATVIWRSLAIFAVLLLGAAALVFLGLGKQNQAVDRVVQHLQPLQVANAQVRADFAHSQALLRGYLVSGQPRFLTLYQGSRAVLAADFATARSLAGGVPRAELATQQRAARAWFGYAGRMEPLAPRSPAMSRLTSQASRAAGTFYAANAQLRSRLQAESHVAITAGQRAVDRTTIIAAVLAGLALLLGITVAAATARSIVAPLRNLTATLRLLTSGDRTARAAVAGAAETREAAVSLNALADESDRLHRREAERHRLSGLARTAGLRIREHLRAEDVLAEARDVLERELCADAAYLHLVEDGRMGPPLGHEHDWILPADFTGLLGAEFVGLMTTMFRERRSMVVQDLGGPDGNGIPPEFRQPQLRAGIVAQIIAPFGVGSELLGIVVLSRLHPGSPWTPAEVDAVESIATDLGRGLQHARMYEAENHLVGELQELDRIKSDFLATVSHELRTPLTSIAGFVELLREQDPGPLTGEQEGMLATIDRNTARLRHLIEDVLTLSRIESRAFKTTRQPVSLTEIARAAVEALQPEATARELSLTLVSSGMLLVSGDPGQLDRMLINLLSNAVKFTPPGGRVEVRAGRDAAMAVITVSDTGIGIPERDQKELFTRFFRASNATERSIPGTGLGLTIVQAIVANHGGELWLRSREGEGTSVAARIPLLTTQRMTAVAEPAGPGAMTAPGRAGGAAGNQRP